MVATVEIGQGLAGPASRVQTDELFDRRRRGAHAAPRRPGAGSWEARYLLYLLVFDALAGLVGGMVAFRLRFGAEVTEQRQVYLFVSVILPAVVIVMLAANGGYERRFLYVGTVEYQRVIRTGLWLAALTAVGAYTCAAPLARGYVATAVPVVVLGCLVARFGLRRRLHRVRDRGRRLRRVVAVGHPTAVAALARQLRRERYHGLDVVGACLPGDGVIDPVVSGMDIPVIGTFGRVGAAVAAARADTVIVLSCPELDTVALRRLSWELESDDIDLMVAGALVEVARARTSIRPVDGLPLLHLEPAKLAGMPHLVKAAMDVVGATVLIAVLAPLFLAIAVAIRMDSPGPVIFRQVRVGRHGREFRIFKFRSMYHGADAHLAALRHRNECDGVLFKMRIDPRVTEVGRWLRRFSLDELPQLFNVVLGQMSLVGPRPPLPEEVAAYPDDLRRRLVVKPGMTGLWQVSGRADLSWEESVRLDLRYVESWSLTLDLVILIRTLSAVARSAGAY